MTGLVVGLLWVLAFSFFQAASAQASRTEDCNAAWAEFVAMKRDGAFAR